MAAASGGDRMRWAWEGDVHDSISFYAVDDTAPASSRSVVPTVLNGVHLGAQRHLFSLFKHFPIREKKKVPPLPSGSWSCAIRNIIKVTREAGTCFVGSSASAASCVPCPRPVVQRMIKAPVSHFHF